MRSFYKEILNKENKKRSWERKNLNKSKLNNQSIRKSKLLNNENELRQIAKKSSKTAKTNNKKSI